MDFKRKATIAQINRYKKNVLDDKEDISLTKIMASEKFQSIILGCREYRDRIDTPLKTLIIFIKQVLHADKSCKNALGCAIAECLNSGESCMSNNTGPYCKPGCVYRRQASNHSSKKQGNPLFRTHPRLGNGMEGM